jgi:ATP adenylyltransferase/5',5'''-P-1,P-4-tetraphosphate phosphorylase II
MKPIENKLLIDAEIDIYISSNDYSSAANYLFESQLNNWELMKKNYDALNSVQTKSFWFDGFKLKIQFNPGRIKSTSAAVDESSIKNRKCFLCIENIPDEQKGILLPDDYVLLCNPYPILPQHFTVCSIKHEPQRVLKAFEEFLELTRLLSPKSSLIYNGPACGASAPDHLHFQAVTKNFIPVENDIQQLKNDFGKIVQEDELITTSFIDDGLRRIVFIESIDKKKAEETFKVIFNIYEKLSGIKSEPMMNLICNYDLEFGWNVIIFLRRKHRPDCFFKEDPNKILISPAAIDLGGVIVTPRETDYLKVDKKMLHQIFNEVSLDKKTFTLLEKKVKSELS